MENRLSKRQMINNELVVRAENKKSLKVLKHHVPVTEQDGQKILFNCECSDPKCNERIALTLKEYELLHNKNARFVIKKDHIEPKVEAATETTDTHFVVEKYDL